MFCVKNSGIKKSVGRNTFFLSPFAFSDKITFEELFKLLRRGVLFSKNVTMLPYFFLQLRQPLFFSIPISRNLLTFISFVFFFRAKLGKNRFEFSREKLFFLFFFFLDSSRNNAGILSFFNRE